MVDIDVFKYNTCINYFLNKKYIQSKKVKTICSFLDLWLVEEMDTYTTSI